MTAAVQRLLAPRSIVILGKASAVLRGVRGKRAVNREALMRLISAVSVFGAVAGGKLAELHLNPVMAGADAAAAVDWLMITR